MFVWLLTVLDKEGKGAPPPRVAPAPKQPPRLALICCDRARVRPTVGRGG